MHYLLLLQVLLGKVLEVALRECDVCCDSNLCLITGNCDHLTKVSCFAVDLDSIQQELLLQCEKGAWTMGTLATPYEGATGIIGIRMTYGMSRRSRDGAYK